MIRFNPVLLKGKSIERLDEWYFRQNPTTDEIELTPFAEDKIVKAMKDFYGAELKRLSLAANDMTYLSKSSKEKEVKDKEASSKLKDVYEVKYGTIKAKLDEDLKHMQQEYKDSHKDEFALVEVLESASYFDGEDYKSSGGNLYELKCTSIKEAAIGYQTASEFLKDNPIDKSNAPTRMELQAKDRKAWVAEIEKMRQTLLTKPEYKDLPKDIFNPVVMKPEPEYIYSINWRVTQNEMSDPEMLTEAANVYIASMI